MMTAHRLLAGLCALWIAMITLATSARPARADSPPRRVTLVEAVAAAAKAPGSRAGAAQVAAVAAAVQAAGAWPATSLSVATSRRAERLAVAASLPLPVLGTLSAEREAARAELRAAQAEQAQAGHELEREVALAWIELARASAQAELAGQAVSRERSLAEVAAARVQAGDAPRAESLAAEARAQQAQARGHAAVALVASSSLALAALLGWELEVALEPAGGLPELAVLPPSTARDWPGHPALRAATAAVETEQARWLVAQRERWPRLSLDLEGLFDDPTLPGNDARVGITFELPLLGGKHASERAQAARVAAARAAAELVRGQVTGAAQAARLRYQAARELARSLEDTVVPAQRAAAELAAIGYREGQTGLAVVIETERGLTEAQAEAIDAHAAAVGAYVELRFATEGAL